jgi:DNA polymerase delta subunit 1
VVTIAGTFTDSSQGAVQMNGPAVLACHIVNRKSLWGYRGEETVPFIKVTCAEPKGIPKIRDKLTLS